MKQKRSFTFIVGFVFGAILFSTITIYAKDIIAKSTSAKVVNSSQKQTTLKGYEINGEQYFKLSDMAKASNISISYSSSAKKYTLDKTKKYVAEKKEETKKEEEKKKEVTKEEEEKKEEVLEGYAKKSEMTKKGDLVPIDDGKYTIVIGKTEK